MTGKYSPDAEDIVRLKTNCRQWQGSQQISGAFPRYMAALTSCDWRLWSHQSFILFFYIVSLATLLLLLLLPPHTHTHTGGFFIDLHIFCLEDLLNISLEGNKLKLCTSGFTKSQ